MGLVLLVVGCVLFSASVGKLHLPEWIMSTSTANLDVVLAIILVLLGLTYLVTADCERRMRKHEEKNRGG